MIPAPGPVLDATMVAALRAFGSEPGRLLREMMCGFLEEGPYAMDQIEAGRRDRDLARVERFAHRLRGTSAHIGATRLTDAAAGIEGAANRRSVPAVATTVATVRVELDLAMDAARELCRAGAPPVRREEAGASAPGAALPPLAPARGDGTGRPLR